ncbi:unnamed protein product, partial [Polarella glacialis]
MRTAGDDGSFATHIVVSGREPLLVSLTPSALRLTARILPLFLESLSVGSEGSATDYGNDSYSNHGNSNSINSNNNSNSSNNDNHIHRQRQQLCGRAPVVGAPGGQGRGMRFRVVNICEFPVDLELEGGSSASSARIGPTGSLWEPLDEWVFPHFASALRARLPGGTLSEPLLLERFGTVVAIPGIGAVAEMLAPDPSYRLLLLAPLLRLHNQTGLPLVVRFHDALQREE